MITASVARVRTPSTPWRRVLAASLTLAVTLPMVFAGATPASAATANPNAKYLQVYDNNVENLLTAAETCAGDWQDLIHYMVSQSNAPDLFLVQQVDEAKLKTLVAKMEDLLGLDYAWVISNRLAGDTIEKCNGEKQVQRNAIIYRTGRLAPVSGSTVSWQSRSEVGGSCVLNDQDRTVAVRMTFNDKLNTGKTVTAASLHWATAASDGPPCAEINATEAAAQVAKPNSSLTIMGGDTNITDLNTSNGWRPWYSKINGDLGGSLGFRDVIYDDCRETTDGSANAIKACLPWTLVDTDRRIDFLFGKLPGGKLPFIGSEHTITFNEGDAAHKDQTGTDDASLNYSEHRAVMARIHYNTTN